MENYNLISRLRKFFSGWKSVRGGGVMDKGRERGREVVRKGFFQQTMEGWVMESVRGGARKWSETSILSSQWKGG